jgi:hypothetical protein
MSEDKVIEALDKLRQMAYEGKIVAQFLEQNNIPYDYSLSYVILVLFHYYLNDREVYYNILRAVHDLYNLFTKVGKQ